MIVTPNLSERPVPEGSEARRWLEREVKPILRVVRDLWNKTEWTDYTPTWVDPIDANATLGDGTISGKSRVIGSSVDLAFLVAWGSSTAFGTSGLMIASLPDGYQVDLDQMVHADTFFGATYLSGGSVIYGTTGKVLSFFALADFYAGQPALPWFATTGIAPSSGDAVLFCANGLPVKKL